MRELDPQLRRRRARGALTLLGLLLGGLALGFFRIQVLRSSAYALRSESNRLRALPTPAPRGVIYDRHGRIVADNVPGYAIWLLPLPRDTLREVAGRLGGLLGLPPERVEAILEAARRSPGRPVLVLPDADFEEVSRVEERRGELPGLFLEMRPRRRYVGGAAVAHLVGYVGEVSEAELERPEFRGYEPGWIVGKAGVERRYEAILQGRPGVRYVEVDAFGRIVGSFAGTGEVPATPGEDLHLNLDLELQEWIHRIFPDTMRGAVVVLDVEDGGVLALYSSPTFDPNLFVGGVEADAWEALNRDPGRPLLNRAVQGRYAPGSTWKLATAGIGLELGVVAPDETFPIPCEGGMWYGNRYFRCWEGKGHGFLALADAIRHSCDVYFYQLGLRIGLETFLGEGARLGFRGTTGIDLPGEVPGVFPGSVDFWVRRFGYRPTPAEVLNLAIGQGPNAQTPIKMAQFYLALARGGRAPAPRVARDAPAPPALSLDLSAEGVEALREGLRRVVGPGGTAHLSSLEYWELAGKTGTAQNPQDPTRDHAWFVGFAGPRGGDPEVVVADIVEFGEHGSAAAAPLAAKTADFYLRRKHGIPVDTIQTLGEYLRAGRPAPWARWR